MSLELISKLHSSVFSDAEFDLLAFSKMVGEVVDDSVESRIKLMSTVKNVEFFFASSFEGFLDGINFGYINPVRIDLEELTKKFGQAREIPRLKPRSPVPYQFPKLNDNGLSGYLSLGLQGLDCAGEETIVSCNLVRFKEVE